MGVFIEIKDTYSYMRVFILSLTPSEGVITVHSLRH